MQRPAHSCGVAAPCVTLAPALARADTVTDWNGYASTAIVATAGQPPPVAVLSFAMVQGAVYDAVNAIDRGHRPYLAAAAGPPLGLQGRRGGDRGVPRPRRALPGPAANAPAALRRVARRGPDTPPGAKAGGIAAGEAAAAAMLAARANDGRFGPFTPVIGTTPGVWRPTPPLFARTPLPGSPTYGRSSSPTSSCSAPTAPTPLTSRAYATDFNEIKNVGALHSTTRTADQTDAAIFWQDHAFALWNRVFRTLAADRHLDIVDSARLFAIENLAAADAAIGCWNNKYHWNSWRPITAIREAASDGNPATEADPTWTPLFDPSTPVATPPALVTPPFPEHPSGHNCAAGAIVRTLQVLLRHRQGRVQRLQQQVRDHADASAASPTC